MPDHRTIRVHPCDLWASGDGATLGSLPTAKDLDKAVADRPAIILDNTIHDGWLNAAGITMDSKDTVPGVTYWERDADGHPTGAAIEIQWFEAYITMRAWDAGTMIPDSAKLPYDLSARNGTTTILWPGAVTPNIKDVHGGMEEDFPVAMAMLHEWEIDGTLKMRTQAQPMYKTTEGDPQRFVDFGATINQQHDSNLLRVTSLKIDPELNTSDEADRWMTLLMSDLKELRKG